MAPASRWGTARSSRARATAWPSARTERTSTATSSAGTPPRTSRSTSAATAWAWARSPAARQKRTLPPAGASRRFSIRSASGSTTAPAAATTRCGQRKRALQAHGARAGQLAPEVAQVLGRRAAQAARGLVVVAGGGQRAVPARVGRRRGQQHDEAQRGVLEVLHVVDEQVAMARGGAGADVRAVADERMRAQDEVAGVERALRGEQPVVVLVDAGELALALGRLVVLAQRGGPARVLRRGDHGRLEAIDPRDHVGQQRGRVAAEVMDAQGQLVDVLEQHGEPVGRADRRDERVEPGLERLVVQQPGAEAVDGVDGELLEAAGEQVLDPGAQRVGRRLAGGQGQDLLGRRPAVGGQPRVTVHERARLARPGRPDDEQRTAAVGHHGLLGRRE